MSGVFAEVDFDSPHHLKAKIVAYTSRIAKLIASSEQVIPLD